MSRVEYIAMWTDIERRTRELFSQTGRNRLAQACAAAEREKLERQGKLSPTEIDAMVEATRHSAVASLVTDRVTIVRSVDNRQIRVFLVVLSLAPLATSRSVARPWPVPRVYFYANLLATFTKPCQLSHCSPAMVSQLHPPAHTSP